MASKKNGVLYIGVTNDLKRRVFEHKELSHGFTQKYFIRRLVYFEETNSITAAIQREKQLKKWKRAWKIELFEKENPEWSDLFDDL